MILPVNVLNLIAFVIVLGSYYTLVHKNSRQRGCIMAMELTAGITDCMSLCGQLHCLSLNFNPHTEECEILKYYTTNEPQQAMGWDYYAIL